jgi:hypothetical protein
MAHPARAPLTQPSGYPDSFGTNEASSSALSWAAVIGGAFVVAATSLILLALGTGIGLSSVSPWSNAGSAASIVGTAAIVWLVCSQIVASAIGGYIAGRLRTKWVNVHTDEVYFRDTAHGLLVWAVGLVITAAFLATAATSIAGKAAQGAALSPTVNDPDAYFIDSLFRSDRPNPEQNDAAVRSEVANIFANDLQQAVVPAADKAYLAKLVAARTGLAQGDAANRVSEIFAAVRQAADAARKAGAHLSYWTFFALLVGAFCASFAATVGGKQRDHIRGA